MRYNAGLGRDRIHVGSFQLSCLNAKVVQAKRLGKIKEKTRLTCRKIYQMNWCDGMSGGQESLATRWKVAKYPGQTTGHRSPLISVEDTPSSWHKANNPPASRSIERQGQA